MENYMNKIDTEKPGDILNELFEANSRKQKPKVKPKFLTLSEKRELADMEPKDRLNFLWQE